MLHGLILFFWDLIFSVGNILCDSHPAVSPGAAATAAAKRRGHRAEGLVLHHHDDKLLIVPVGPGGIVPDRRGDREQGFLPLFWLGLPDNGPVQEPAVIVNGEAAAVFIGIAEEEVQLRDAGIRRPVRRLRLWAMPLLQEEVRSNH